MAWTGEPLLTPSKFYFLRHPLTFSLDFLPSVLPCGYLRFFYATPFFSTSLSFLTRPSPLLALRHSSFKLPGFQSTRLGPTYCLELSLPTTFTNGCFRAAMVDDSYYPHSRFHYSTHVLRVSTHNATYTTIRPFPHRSPTISTNGIHRSTSSRISLGKSH